jgi:secreted PhoX family phosphatase
MKHAPNSENQNIDPDDIGYNISENASFDEVLSARMSRRSLLKGGFYLMAGSMIGGTLSACSDDDPAPAAPAAPATGGNEPLALSFNPVAKGVADALSVPAGYSAKVLYATGDPINNLVSAYLNDGSDTDFANRSGDHHDGMSYFGMNSSRSAWDSSISERGLLCMNHEVAEDFGFMHVNGPTSAVDRPTGEIDKEVEAHGVSIVEVVRDGASYSIDRNSAYNRRVTGATLMDLHGPVAGSNMAVTAFSTDGTQTRGTVNNCANGYTPWGTYLTCEENWAGYFYRQDSARDPKEEASLSRYGIRSSTNGRYNWSRPSAGDSTDLYRRWNASVTGASASDDFRNVPNTFGWVVEIDPFKPTSTPRKRTAMGRIGHEGCWPAPAVAGQPLVFYMGDDARNEYIYKFVSSAAWDVADVNGGLAAGDKYLNSGTLYVARFDADGSGVWLPISLSNSAISGYTTYSFADAADVLINTRHAADAVGATKMDRPEWGGVHPVTGDVYMTLTNSASGSSGRGNVTPLDPANPRFYTEQRSGSALTPGNVNGHIIRWKEQGDNHAATSFEWDIYLFGAESSADGSNVNVSGLVDDNDFSSPDGLWFSQANPGLLWVQTDDGAYRDVTNCMMLAAIPGQVGDGGQVAVTSTAVPTNSNNDQTVNTYVGAAATTTTLRRFLVGPHRCEVTGITETPDGRAIFVNIQHPGEGSSDIADPGTWTSHWPDGGSARPRSATVVITRDDGGKIAV